MKKGLEKFRKIMLYGGLEPGEYESAVPDIADANLRSLSAFSAAGMALFAVLAITSAVSNTFATINFGIYAACAVLSAAIFILSKTVVQQHKKISAFLIIIFMLVLYGYSTAITILHPNQVAVTLVAMLMAVPLVFTDNPLKAVLITFIATTVCTILVGVLKEPEIALEDTWNLVSFGVLAMIAETYINSIKIQGVYHAVRLAFLNESDRLTGVKNRNCYEERLPEYAAMDGKSLTCVYFDVNGLHALNDTKGHAAGDEMLRFSAKCIQEQFGVEDTYRIGGDEFIAFAPNMPLEDAVERVMLLQDKAGERGYSISAGCAEMELGGLEIRSLIKKAEDRMYEAKNEYYISTGKAKRV